MAEANGAAAGAANGASGATNGAAAAAANGAAAGAANGAANGGANGGERHTSIVAALGVDGKAAPNGAANGAANGQPAGVGHNGGPPFYPEGLPEPYRGASDRETIEKLARDVGLVRRAPEKPEAYKLELKGEMAARYKNLDNDPVYPIARQVAHKAGLDNAQFQTMFTEFYSALHDKGLLEPTIDIDAEVRLLAPKAADPATAKAQASVRLNGVLSGVRALEGRQIISKKGAEALQSAAVTAEGAIALEAVLRLAGEQGVQVGGVPAAHGETKEQAMRLMTDERYSSTSPKHDPAFRRDADARIEAAARRR